MTARSPGSSVRLDGVQDQLGVLRHRELGRNIGRCERCGKPVRSQQSFMRKEGVIAHVRCRITRSLTRPSPP
jgi:hypothetical protein